MEKDAENILIAPMPRLIQEVRKDAEGRVRSVSRICFVLLGDAFIFVMWLIVSYGCSSLCAFFKTRGLDSTVEMYFLFAAHWGVFLLAVGYIVSDIVGVVGEIIQRWRDVRQKTNRY